MSTGPEARAENVAARCQLPVTHGRFFAPRRGKSFAPRRVTTTTSPAARHGRWDGADPRVSSAIRGLTRPDVARFLYRCSVARSPSLSPSSSRPRARPNLPPPAAPAPPGTSPAVAPTATPPAPAPAPSPAPAEPGTLYQTPPPNLVRLADAPYPLIVVPGPDDNAVLLAEVPPLLPIAEVAQPELKLAGLRFNPANSAETRAYYVSSLAFLEVQSGKSRAITGVPADGRVRQPSWSPDGKHVAFTVARPTRVELWIANRAGGDAHRLGDLAINAAHPSRACRWLGDSSALVCRVVPAGRGPAPERSEVPTGPLVEENLGKKTPAPTFQDLLRDEHDAALFEHYFAAEVWIVALDGNQRRVGGPGLIVDANPSPDAASNPRHQPAPAVLLPRDPGALPAAHRGVGPRRQADRAHRQSAARRRGAHRLRRRAHGAPRHRLAPRRARVALLGRGARRRGSERRRARARRALHARRAVHRRPRRACSRCRSASTTRSGRAGASPSCTIAGGRRATRTSGASLPTRPRRRRRRSVIARTRIATPTPARSSCAARPAGRGSSGPIRPRATSCASARARPPRGIAPSWTMSISGR